MFSKEAVIDGVVYPSDSAAMAEALFLPYWFWGSLVAVFSTLSTVVGILIATKKSQ